MKCMHRGSIIFTSENLRPGILAFGVNQDDYTYPIPIFLKIQGKLIIHGNGFHNISYGANLTIRESGILEIGNDFCVGEFAVFRVAAHSKIGNNNMHSWNNLYMDTDAHPIYDAEGNMINLPKAFEFGDDVWVGARSTILKGVKIANGCIIANGSFITKSLPKEKTIYASSRELKTNVTWTHQII